MDNIRVMNWGEVELEPEVDDWFDTLDQGVTVMSERRSWSEKRADIMSVPGAGAAYEAARVRFELGEAVRHRREELGITQAELAERAGLQQPAVARFESGGTMPTIPMLERLADALLLRLNVEFLPLREAS
jgi:HTH-type transcriptional regulator / antitoxin HipB